MMGRFISLEASTAPTDCAVPRCTTSIVIAGHSSATCWLGGQDVERPLCEGIPPPIPLLYLCHAEYRSLLKCCQSLADCKEACVTLL